jgi:hypothetical protein
MSFTAAAARDSIVSHSVESRTQSIIPRLLSVLAARLPALRHAKVAIGERVSVTDAVPMDFPLG